MSEKRYAVIDIGSNSVRMLVQGFEGRVGVTTRLGAGLAQSGRLDNERAKQSAFVIAGFVSDAKRLGCIPLAYATSAVRDAENRAEFLELVKLTSGLSVDVLSGEREAQYAYSAACGERGGLLDIGGASMQLVSGNFKKSFPVGCVRGRDIATELAKDCANAHDYSVQRERLAEYLDSLVEPYVDALRGEVFAPCTGVGGTINTLCALSVDIGAKSKKAGNGVSLTREKLEELIKMLVHLGNARSAIGALKSRHDVILYGAALLARAMDILKLDSITGSLRDGLDGYLEAAVRGELDN